VKLHPTKLQGVYLIVVAPLADARGNFARTFCVETLRRAGAAFGPVRQMSISVNDRKATLRGLHWQAGPRPEAKIVRPVRGRIFDVALDLRPASPSFKQWFGVELNAAHQNALLIPQGCAHGFVTLQDDCAIEYVMDADFDPALARGARWDDPAFAIAWPLLPAMIGERDRVWPDFVG
jgi:dTDP-4-dehydrorhamnose 3,5-epimerase